MRLATPTSRTADLAIRRVRRDVPAGRGPPAPLAEVAGNGTELDPVGVDAAGGVIGLGGPGAEL